MLTREEANAILAHLSHENRLLASMLYGSGLRLMEAVRLRVKDTDLSRNEIIVRDGKGEKDRITMLPQSIRMALKVQLAHKTKAATSSPRRRSPKHNHLGVPGARHSATP